MNHAFAVAITKASTPNVARVPTLNGRLIGVLGLNVGFWALVILAGRALYA